MRKVNLQPLLILLLLIGVPGAAARAAEPGPPTISVDADGKVAAKPDMATMTLEVETQAPKSQTAAQENARRSDALLKALKKVLAPEDKIQSASYRLLPLRNYRSKEKPQAITGYQAVHRFKVEVRDPARLALVLDTALEHGVSRVNGPYWGHSRLEELQRQAAVEALGKARRMAEALAQAAGVKIKGLYRLSTRQQTLYPRAAADVFLKAKAPVPTPIEVGEEEIKASVNAVFAVAP